MNTQPTQMWSIKEASEATGLSLYYIRQVALSGNIAAIRTGTKRSKILINAQSLKELLTNSTLTKNSDTSAILNGIRKISE